MDFPLTPDFPVVETKKYSTLVSESESGVEQRRSKWSLPLREFDLSFSNREQADYDSLISFHDTMLGAFGTFNFNNPNDGQTYTCRFKEDSLRSSLRHYQIFSMECTIIEVKA